MGLTFKENCPDLRNTRVVDIIAELKNYNCEVDVYDPWVSVEEAQQEYGLTPMTALPASSGKGAKGNYDAIILAVAHRQFREAGPAAIRAWLKPKGVLYDVKHVLPKEAVDARL